MKNSPSVFFLTSFIIFVLDQVTKYLIRSHLSLFEVINVLPFFNIVYVENTGSAFGMFKGLGNIVFIAIASVAIVSVVVLLIKDRENRTGFSLILGGAAGNLADRVFLGHVVDFLDVFVGKFHWPAFNVADSALTVGIALLAVNSLLQAKQVKITTP